MQAPAYSTLFTCLHDEPEPIGSGNLGRGTHYSVFRSVEWLDVVRAPLQKPQIHDFAVVWDEDHDTRVIQAVEAIYMAGLLSPIQFIGERKGTLTVIVAAKFYWIGKEADIEAYTQAVQDVVTHLGHGDYWHVEVGMFDRAPGNPHQNKPCALIQDKENRVLPYLLTIDALWSLGTKDFRLQAVDTRVSARSTIPGN